MNYTEALDKAVAWMDEIEGVEGVADGMSGKEACILVFLSLPEAANKIPKTFHGFKVLTEFTGEFDAQM